MNVCHIYDILLSREKSWNTKNPIDKGKPFERMGHKALEPKSPEGLMVVSCQKDDIKDLKQLIFRWKNELFLLPCLCPKRAQMFQAEKTPNHSFHSGTVQAPYHKGTAQAPYHKGTAQGGKND